MIADCVCQYVSKKFIGDYFTFKGEGFFKCLEFIQRYIFGAVYFCNGWLCGCVLQPVKCFFEFACRGYDVLVRKTCSGQAFFYVFFIVIPRKFAVFVIFVFSFLCFWAPIHVGFPVMRFKNYCNHNSLGRGFV